MSFIKKLFTKSPTLTQVAPEPEPQVSEKDTEKPDLKLPRCCICGDDLSNKPTMKDQLTGLLFCHNDRAMLTTMIDTQLSLSRCGECSFMYSKAFSYFANDNDPECPRCKASLAHQLQTRSRDMAADSLETVRNWMQNCPSADPEKAFKLFQDYAKSWNLPFIEGSGQEISSLFDQCLQDDRKNGLLMTSITGIDREHLVGDVWGSTKQESWWESFEIPLDSVISISLYDGYHIIGKIDEDRFLLLVHGGTVAQSIKNKPGSHSI
ncbi:MAG: hypothetical protein ACM3PE_10160 [Deltaproteobacteria bacterium]